MLRKGMQQIPPFLLLCITFTYAIHLIFTGKFTQTHGDLHTTFAAVARVLKDHPQPGRAGEPVGESEHGRVSAGAGPVNPRRWPRLAAVAGRVDAHVAT